MSVTIDLPDEALRRLQAEADRHGVPLADVIAELAEQLPAGASRPKAKRKLAFVGIGASSHVEGGSPPESEGGLCGRTDSVGWRCHLKGG